ncbi:MAG: DUF1080 domain-containing protein [bacterium]|nr:DUF1080 domain-containing protein [bacterium]
MRALLGLFTLTACVAAPGQYPPALVLPPRSIQAVDGSQLLPHLIGKSVSEREGLIWHEVAAGNVPELLRELVPVTTQAIVQGTLRTATFWCTRDYFGIGSDGDWFRLPITPRLAEQIAERLDCVLPTRKMVDAIWQHAPVKLAPFPYSPSSYNITSVALFHQHHLQIESQRGNQPLSLLVAGIKKDVVASHLIANWPSRVCIYGWHYQNGAAIQPLSKVHGTSYVDYSHGTRLVARMMEIDGVRTTVDAVLADPQLHVLLSDEGAFTSWRYPAGTAESFPIHDRFPASGPERTGWRRKFTNPISVTANPPAPSGDQTVLRIMDPAGGTDTLRLSGALAGDVEIQADLLCEYRPGLASNGFERIGVFARDQANGAFEGTLSQAGACYALTWDSSNGRVQCLRAHGGTLTDLLPAPQYLPGTRWRRFRIAATGNRLRFWLDGVQLLDTTDNTFANGEFGIGYHEYFATNSFMRGTRVDTFHAEVPDALTLELRPGLQPGELRVQRRRGTPGDTSFTAWTVTRGAFPDGWFFGLDPTMPDLLSQAASGHPAFVGRYDYLGRHDLVAYGLPIGVDIQSVTVALDPTLRTWQASAPTAVRIR